MCQLLAITIFIPNDKPAVKNYLENFRQCGLTQKLHRDVGTSQRESRYHTSKRAYRFGHKYVRANIPARQRPSSPTTNLNLLLGLFQGSMQETPSFLRKYRTSSHAASWGERNFSSSGKSHFGPTPRPWEVPESFGWLRYGIHVLVFQVSGHSRYRFITDCTYTETH